MGRDYPDINRAAFKAGGFTLIEVGVAVGVIALLAAILLPVLGHARESGRAAVCASNLRQMMQITQQYTMEHRGLLPKFFYEQPTGNSNNLVLLTKSNGKDKTATGWGEYPSDILVCPTDEDPIQRTIRGENVDAVTFDLSYGYNLELLLRNKLAKLRLHRLPLPSETAFFFDGYATGKDQGAYKGTRDHADTIADGRHSDRFNSVFVDGHVESLEQFGANQIDGGLGTLVWENDKGNGNGNGGGNGSGGSNGNGGGSGSGGSNGNGGGNGSGGSNGGGSGNGNGGGNGNGNGGGNNK